MLLIISLLMGQFLSRQAGLSDTCGSQQSVGTNDRDSMVIHRNVAR